MIVLASAAMGFGGWYALTRQGETGSYDLDDIPLAQAFWSAGYVTLLMYAKSYFGVGWVLIAVFVRVGGGRGREETAAAAALRSLPWLPGGRLQEWAG